MHTIETIVEEILHGGEAAAEVGHSILRATGAELTQWLAGAHRLREQFFGRQVHLCSIINAKSGRCPENCAFCAQSAHHHSQVDIYPLQSRDALVAGAIQAQEAGSNCYGIVTSGTRATPAEMETILAALREIRSRCRITPSVSLGLLDAPMAQALAEAGCGTYHHNLETARSHFPAICTTHDYEEDVDTVRLAKAAGMQVCCGGILGLGETPAQRVELALTLRELQVDSVPLNFLNPVAGTPLADRHELSPLDCLRSIAMFRFLLPRARISVCGGREVNLREYQSWIFSAGASGMMIGNYLTTSGRDAASDLQLIRDGGFEPCSCSDPA